MKMLTMALALTISMAAVKPAKAALTPSFGTTQTVVYGILFTVGGAGLTVFSFKERPMYQRVMMIVAGVPLAGLGLLLLDGEQGQQVAFGELSSEDASQMGVSESERLIFNSELDQANFLTTHVESRMVEIKSPSNEDSIAAWAEVKNEVSPETLSVMAKVLSQLAE